MESREALLHRIKNTVGSTDPKASLILYGSYARGDEHEHSDLDLLILLDQEEVTRADQKRIKYPLYDIEFDAGVIISPMVLSRQAWEGRHRKTPFYENVMKEGQVI